MLHMQSLHVRVLWTFRRDNIFITVILKLLKQDTELILRIFFVYKSALISSLPLIWLVYVGLLRVSSLRSISPPFPSFSVCVSESVSPPSDWPELLFLLNGPRADWLPRPFRHAAEGAFLLEVSSCQRHM